MYLEKTWGISLKKCQGCHVCQTYFADETIQDLTPHLRRERTLYKQTHSWTSNLIFVPAGHNNAVILHVDFNPIGWAAHPSHTYQMCWFETQLSWGSLFLNKNSFISLNWRETTSDSCRTVDWTELEQLNHWGTAAIIPRKKCKEICRVQSTHSFNASKIKGLICLLFWTSVKKLYLVLCVMLCNV